MNPIAEPDDTQQRVMQLQDALADGDLAAVREALSTLHPFEIADLLEALPPRDRDELWQLVSPDQEAEVLSHAQDRVRSALLEQMHPREVAAATQRLDSDDAADILQDLPEPMVDEVLRSMDEQNRLRLTQVLSYPEDTAGGLMNVDTVTVRSDVELDVVLRYLRLKGRLPEHTDSLMVVDRQNGYLGALPVTTVLTQEPEKTVAEVMTNVVEAIAADTPAIEVAKIFEQRDLVSAPVVDAQGRLLGRITIDDVVDVIREQSGGSLLRFWGLNQDEDLFAPPMASARRRAFWLGVNLATCFLAASVIGLFEQTLQQFVALAILMPIVASMGGIAGSQTLALVIRGLALGHVGWANARPLLLKELAVGCANGMLWALVVGGVARWWFGNARLGVIIGLAMVINLIAAALAGALVPLGMRKIGIDPALAGGVVLTTVTDCTGFFVFLGLATLLLL
ncbi:MAG: magnesium transporter [Chromatiales bacterium]